MTPVQEQFARVKRWYKLFEEISTGRIHDRESDYYQDVVYAYFQNCWHLKDWIHNSTKLDKLVIDDFFHKDADLKLCQALAIGSKHLAITNQHVDPSVAIRQRKYSITFNSDPPVLEVVFLVKSNAGGPINGFELATICLAKCESFLQIHGLLESANNV